MRRKCSSLKILFQELDNKGKLKKKWLILEVELTKWVMSEGLESQS